MAVASRLSGMHPQTLRKYERAGLVLPLRKGRIRLYSDLDIERLMLVRKLTEGCGLNIAGIAMALRVREILLKVRHDLASELTKRSMSRMLSTIAQLQNELEGQTGRIEPKRKYSRRRRRTGLNRRIVREVTDVH